MSKYTRTYYSASKRHEMMIEEINDFHLKSAEKKLREALSGSDTADEHGNDKDVLKCLQAEIAYRAEQVHDPNAEPLPDPQSTPEEQGLTPGGERPR